MGLRSLIAIRICDQLNLIKNDLGLTSPLILCVMPKQKYCFWNSKTMDITEMRAFMEMHGYPFGFSLSPFAQLRYPPGLAGPTSPTRLKEKMIAENSTFTGKINEFNRMYLKHASGLLDMSASMFAPGHPMAHKLASDYAEKDELAKLRLENAELKKRIESFKNKKV
jgi:hypothetical protein